MHTLKTHATYLHANKMLLNNTYIVPIFTHPSGSYLYIIYDNACVGKYVIRILYNIRNQETHYFCLYSAAALSPRRIISRCRTDVQCLC